MKKLWMVCALVLCLALSGCGQKLPEKAADGTAWDENWLTLGTRLGVETPESWAVERSEDVLAAEGMYYALWTTGEPLAYTNEAGDEITTHDGEIHLVVTEVENTENAKSSAQELQAMTRERYPELETSTAEYAGQTFEISTYATPVFSAASATGVRGETVIRVDVTVLSRLGTAPAQVLADFLEHCHYAA